MPYKPRRNKPLAQKRSRKDERGSASTRGYDRKHRNLCKQEQQEQPLCVYCLQRGKVTASEVTDHITAMARGGDALDPSNRQRLCKMCNSVKAATTDKGLINTNTEWGPL